MDYLHVEAATHGIPITNILKTEKPLNEYFTKSADPDESSLFAEIKAMFLFGLSVIH